MTELDLDWVLSVEAQSYPVPWSRGGFVNSLDRGVNFVFEDVSLNPFGYACLLTIVDEIELLNFCISPAYKGKGYGTQAITALMEYLAESSLYHRVLLEVRPSNQPAIALYQKVGFVKDGVRKNYYPATKACCAEDAILMSLALTDK